MVEDMLGFAVCGMGGVLFFVLSRRLYADALAPAGIYGGGLLASLGLWHLRLYPLVPISFEVYVLVVLSLLGFYFGVLAGSGKAFVRGWVLRPQAEPLVGLQGLRWFFYCTATLATMGWIVLLILFVGDFSLKTVWERPYLLQGNFQSRQYIGYLNLVGILVLPSFVLLWGAGSRRPISIIFVASALVGLLLAGIKAYVIFSLVTALLAWSCIRPRGVPLAWLGFAALGILVFFLIYDALVDVFVVSDGATDGGVDWLAEAFRRPYEYIVGGWSALSVLVEAPPQQPLPGYITLLFFWKIVGELLHVVPAVPEVEPFLDIGVGSVRGFNVYTFIGGLYWDWGYLGVLVGSAFFGLVSTVLYLKARSTNRWFWVLLSAVVSYGLVLAFFVYYYRFNLIFLAAYIALWGLGSWFLRWCREGGGWVKGRSSVEASRMDDGAGSGGGGR